MINSVLNIGAKVASSILDKTIVLSFDKTGYNLHKTQFVDDLPEDLTGKVAIVTGANSGMGFETSLFLAKAGAEVHLLCRNEIFGKDAVGKIEKLSGNNKLFLHIVDISSNKSINAFAREFKNDKLDILVNNAGVLPSEKILTDDNLELTWATNIRGPFLLTHKLMENLQKSESPRSVFVSSGGMYPQKIDLDDLLWEKKKFDGVKAYANTKRAMVIINEMLADKFAHTPIRFHAMHPGWADTPAVKTSIPKFYNIMKKILRTAKEGADTIIWLAASETPQRYSGKFWFDRQIRKTHIIWGTRESQVDRDKLWEILQKQSGLAE